jgi:tRNA dimethylallyltransferase
MYSPEVSPIDNSESPEIPKIPLVVILGPTAVGKTEVSIELAEKFEGEIVSADSRLFYRGMDIGTAKPSLQERSRVPHHLIDVANPDETWSLALFQANANQAIYDIFRRRHLPFMVGGTGQFIRSVIEGWKVPPVYPDPGLRKILERWAVQIGGGELHHKLEILDPRAANSIDATNIRRTIRALEVTLTTGKRFSEQRISGQSLYQPLQIGLTRPRPEIYQMIDTRIERMIEGGFIDEVQGLLNAGYSPELPTLSAIGYREIVGYLQGKSSLEEAIILMKRRTREFVRRQANWFKENDRSIQWFRMDAVKIHAIEIVIKEWLNNIRWHNIRTET